MGNKQDSGREICSCLVPFPCGYLPAASAAKLCLQRNCKIGFLPSFLEGRSSQLGSCSHSRPSNVMSAIALSTTPPKTPCTSLQKKREETSDWAIVGSFSVYEALQTGGWPGSLRRPWTWNSFDWRNHSNGTHSPGRPAWLCNCAPLGGVCRWNYTVVFFNITPWFSFPPAV